jgi:hypothetical protein
MQKFKQGGIHVEYYNKHYIVVDLNSYVIKGFSDAFEIPQEDDICINHEGGRHFELLGVINPDLLDFNRCHLYKYIDGVIKETTKEERAAELDAKTRDKTSEEQQAEYLLDLDYRLSKLELGV